MVGIPVFLCKLQQLACLAYIYQGLQGSCPELGCFVTKMSECLVAPSTLITWPSHFLLKNPIFSLKPQIKKRLLTLHEEQTMTAWFGSMPSQLLQERAGAGAGDICSSIHTALLPPAAWNVLALCNRILSIHREREGFWHRMTRMAPEDMGLSEISQSHRTHMVRCYFCEVWRALRASLMLGIETGGTVQAEERASGDF